MNHGLYSPDRPVDDPERLGIGRGLLDAVRSQVGPEVLIAAPGVKAYDEKIGMSRVAHAFTFDRMQ